jgi:colicin import membrane protein
MLSLAQRQRNKRKKAALLKYGTTSDKLLNAPTATDLNSLKVAARRRKQDASRKVSQAAQKRETRMVQLAKMPKGRGASEYKRLKEGGELKETAGAKTARQRKAQLAGMPKGRGKVDSEKVMGVAKQQESKRAARAQAARADAAKKTAEKAVAAKKAAEAKKKAAMAKKANALGA